MILQPLTADDMEMIRAWRHDVPETLRTPYMLTREMQQDYYQRVICNRDSHTRYWGLWDNFPHEYDDLDPDDLDYKGFLGYGGIENISWENGNGEISLLIRPDLRGRGYGTQAVDLFLDRAFGAMRLETVYGECYYCGPVEFWKKIVDRYGAYDTILPRRKFWDNQYHDSYYFSIDSYMWECTRREEKEAEIEDALHYPS